MVIAQVRQLPIQYAGQPVPLDQQVAQPVVAVDQSRPGGSGQVIGEPAQRERDDRAVAARGVELLAQSADAFGGIERRNAARQLVWRQ